MELSLLSSYKNIFSNDLQSIADEKLLINTINAHSFNLACTDKVFNNSLHASHILLPDGISIVWALRLITGKKLQKIAGLDLFMFEMERVNQTSGKCFFLGSSPQVLENISKKAKKEFPNAQVFTYSPPYKAVFTAEDTQLMINEINKVQPAALFIGMTAPKQEKWAFENFSKLNALHVCSVGAVFDFYAGNIQRAPGWVIKIGLEWFYRLLAEPKRLWKRYLIGNVVFIKNILKEKFG